MARPRALFVFPCRRKPVAVRPFALTTSLRTRHIQQVIQKTQKTGAGLPRHAHITALRAVQRCFFQQLQHAEYALKRCAQFRAHVLKKGIPGTQGRFARQPGLFQPGTGFADTGNIPDYAQGVLPAPRHEHPGMHLHVHFPPVLAAQPCLKQAVGAVAASCPHERTVFRALHIGHIHGGQFRGRIAKRFCNGLIEFFYSPRGYVDEQDKIGCAFKNLAIPQFAFPQPQFCRLALVDIRYMHNSSGQGTRLPLHGNGTACPHSHPAPVAEAMLGTHCIRMPGKHSVQGHAQASGIVGPQKIRKPPVHNLRCRMPDEARKRGVNAHNAHACVQQQNAFGRIVEQHGQTGTHVLQRHLRGVVVGHIPYQHSNEHPLAQRGNRRHGYAVQPAVSFLHGVYSLTRLRHPLKSEPAPLMVAAIEHVLQSLCPPRLPQDGKDLCRRPIPCHGHA